MMVSIDLGLLMEYTRTFKPAYHNFARAIISLNVVRKMSTYQAVEGNYMNGNTANLVL